MVDVTQILLTIASVAIVPLIIYAVKINREQYKHGIQLEKLHECDARIEDKIDDFIQQTTKDQLETQQLKRDNNHIAEQNKTESRADKKDIHIQVETLTNKIAILSEKVVEFERIHIEFRQMLKDQQEIFIERVQRLEDIMRDQRTSRSPKSKRTSN